MQDNYVQFEESLMTVKVVKRPEDGVFTVEFKVPGGTVNEFVFGTDEGEAKAKVAMLIDSMKQGLEYIQDRVREIYSEAEESN